VELVEQVGVGPQPGQVGLLEAAGVDPGQPVAVPGGGRPGHPEQVAQPVAALDGQPLGRPAQPLDVLGHQAGQVGQVPLPELLVLGHRPAPRHGPRATIHGNGLNQMVPNV
jgi:hypothetical protein